MIAIPTETVYGLAADAANDDAVRRIFELKGRPANHPVIVHIAAASALDEWAHDVPQAARTLAGRFWPGPLTLILQKAPQVSPIVTGGQSTVGLRCPSHPVAQALLRAFRPGKGGGIAAPSANKFGHVSPTTAEHVRDEFGGGLFVLDGGPCDVGLESTIVDLSRGEAVLLRPGAITREDLATTLGTPVRDRDAQAPRASGTLAAHYAPRTALVVMEWPDLEAELQGRANIAVLSMREPPPTAHVTSWIVAAAGPRAFARDLYANLRRLDASGAKRIVVEAPPKAPAWEAVNDRLQRAAAGAGFEEDET